MSVLRREGEKMKWSRAKKCSFKPMRHRWDFYFEQVREQREERVSLNFF
jgi:hypothetical protein